MIDRIFIGAVATLTLFAYGWQVGEVLYFFAGIIALIYSGLWVWLWLQPEDFTVEDFR